MSEKPPLVMSPSRCPGQTQPTVTMTKAEFSAYAEVLILTGRAGGLSNEAMRAELEDLVAVLER